MALPSGIEPESMVPKTIVLSVTPREQNDNFLNNENFNPKAFVL